MQNGFRKRILLGIGIILSTLVIFLAALNWLSSDVAARSKDLAATRRLVAERGQLIDVLASLKRNSAEVDSYRQQIESLLPAKEELINFPRWLDGLARASRIGLNFNFEGATTPPQPESAGATGFSLIADGSYDNLVIFFREVETKSRQFLLSLDGFDLNRTSDGYRVSTHGRVFFK